MRGKTAGLYVKYFNHDSQMKDLGILGVNILHAVFFKRDRLEEFIESGCHQAGARFQRSR